MLICQFFHFASDGDLRQKCGVICSALKLNILYYFAVIVANPSFSRLSLWEKCSTAPRFLPSTLIFLVKAANLNYFPLCSR